LDPGGSGSYYLFRRATGESRWEDTGGKDDSAESPPTPEWKSLREPRRNDEGGCNEEGAEAAGAGAGAHENAPTAGVARRHSWDGGSPLRPTSNSRHRSRGNLGSRGDGASSSATAAVEEPRGFDAHTGGGGRRKDSRKALRDANGEWRARMAAKKKGDGGGRKEAPAADEATPEGQDSF
jgi:hypothetical protein